jgi:muramoyltetrapeptide carboxypeptidase
MTEKKSICPPYLKPGDCVGIAAPSRKISEAELKPALEILRGWGLNVKTASNVYASLNQFAGSDEQRAAGFQSLLNNPEVKAVFCARGGYGAIRVIDRIDLSHFIKQPKWIVGYSDATVFHSHIARHTGIETLHAPMPVNFGKDAASLERLKQALFGTPLSYSLPAHPLNRAGTAAGSLAGGNLSLLYALASTPSDLHFAGKILFIEDLDEYLYHIDRMMMQLKRAGKLSELKGLVVGGFTDMKDNMVPYGKTAEDIIAEAVKDYGYPVCFGFPAGHGSQNYPLFMGRNMELKVSPKGAMLQ